MPVITYSAVNRGRLVGGHSAGNSYQIECDFESFAETQISKGTFDETLDGTMEGWLDALQFEYNISTDLILNSAMPNWREFFSSVASAETFQIDFTGTISSPGTDIDVYLSSTSVSQTHVGGVGYKYQFQVKTFG
jgi:hypothetical protein